MEIRKADKQIGPIDLDWHEDWHDHDCRVYTTANELNWLRGLYRNRKFDLLFSLRRVYREREWGGEGMRVNRHRVMDALDGICENIQRIIGLRGAGVGVVTGGILRREMLELIERSRRKGQVQ